MECEVRSDYREVLDICTALSDPELSDEERAVIALDIFYPALDEISSKHYQEALERCMWFINCGETEARGGKSPRLVDWEQDFQHIVAPINRVMGQEVRAVEYLHWWTFVAAYREIGDCTFAQIVRIRNQIARGKKLDKSDQEWYRRNRGLVDFKRKYTDADDEVMKRWGGG